YVVDEGGEKKMKVTLEQKERAQNYQLFKSKLQESYEKKKRVSVLVDAKWLKTFEADPDPRYEKGGGIILEGAVTHLDIESVRISGMSGHHEKIPWSYIKNVNLI
ncbi:MAG: hypothetical protein U0946_06495, partial [Patescibacteria group bacterium]|nr:hypothetical protein [Patescibacteria group bacterium]